MKWKIKDRKYFQPYIEGLENKYKKIGIGTIMARILENRGYNYEDIKRLIEDPGFYLGDPKTIAGCTEVGNAIIELLNSGMKFWIFADYDVDGLTAGYIMVNYLRFLGVDADVYYPERHEGYGLSVQFLQGLKEDNVVITVDNGITAEEAMRYCHENGIPLIITDHHRPLHSNFLFPVCDPFLDKNGYGHHLCGAAVAWKVCQYIDMALGFDEVWKFAPYVALGTIADVMPMTFENMAIVRIGLQLMTQGFSPNLHEYLKFLGIKEPTSEDIAWKLAPALNACGRMGNTALAAKLLFFEGTKGELFKIMSEIDSLNSHRKALSADAVKEAVKQDYDNDAFCLFDATKYPSGISGIIAGKLVETFNKPAIVYHRNNSGIWPGSMRSNGFDMLPWLEREKIKGNIYDFGGHSQACGVFLFPDITNFKHSMNGLIRLPLEQFGKQEQAVDVDMEISLSDVTMSLYNDITKIPTDRYKFTKPTFIVKDLRVHEVYHSSNNPNNIRFTLIDRDKELHKLWAWNKDQLYKALGSPERIDIMGSISLGFGKDSDKVVFNVEDMRCCN